jgi:hypothetical protein
VDVHDGWVWDDAVPVAELESGEIAGHEFTALRLAAPVIVGRRLARGLVDAITRAGVEHLVVHDELVRAEARAVGWHGGLRAPLAAPSAATLTATHTALDPVAAVGALLPEIHIERRSWRRRTLVLRASTTDDIRLAVKIAARTDVVPELLAAALDTAIAIRRRFGRMASGVHTIAIDDGAGSFDDHSTLGSAQSGTGTFFLDTSLAAADALDAQRLRTGGRRGASARVPPPWFTIDGVVAHEYWHNLDTTVVSSPATYTHINRELGALLGVETFEFALRGRERDAPPAWQDAFRRVVDEVSPYAATAMREATAELFKLWWCSSPSQLAAPLVARFGALLDEHYPPR